MTDSIQAVVDRLHQLLPSYLSWVAPLVKGTLDYLSGPFVGDGGRYPLYGIVAAFVITACMFFLFRERAETRRAGDFFRYCFPREIYWNKSLWVDLKVGFVNTFVGRFFNLTWRINTALIASGITWLLTAMLGPSAHQASWGLVSITLFAMAMSAASDFGYFLFHWTAHKFPPLWAIHKLHHSAEVMTPLTAARVHPLERAFMGPFMSLTTGVLVGPALYFYAGTTSAPAIFGLELPGLIFFGLGHLLHHSHVWVYFGPVIGRIIVSPAQHQIHHSSLPHHLDKNFAEHWAIWDTLFGTLYLPKGRETLKLGLAGVAKQPHRGLITAYAMPMLESVVVAMSIGWRWIVRSASVMHRRVTGLLGMTHAAEHAPDLH